MEPTDLIAHHPFFGHVTADGWDLVFHPEAVDRDLRIRARVGREPSREHFDKVGPLLPTFEKFCRQLDEHDRAARAHFLTWPRAAGNFALIGAMLEATGDLTWLQTGSAAVRPFALYYRALDEDAWDYAEIYQYPAHFFVAFDREGTFAGVDEIIERGMRTLPEVIEQPRWAGGFDHPFFGPCDLSGFDEIATIDFAGRAVTIDLVMSPRTMVVFEPEMLDPAAALLQKIADLDASVRGRFPPEVREAWLADRYDVDHGPSLREALQRAFPGAGKAADVSPQAFAAALELHRGTYAIAPDGTYAATLTLDYRILPDEVDNYLFAAKFSAKGAMLEICTES